MTHLLAPRRMFWGTLLVILLLMGPVGFPLIVYFGAQPALNWYLLAFVHAATKPVLLPATRLLLASLTGCAGLALDFYAWRTS